MEGRRALEEEERSIADDLGNAAAAAEHIVDIVAEEDIADTVAAGIAVGAVAGPARSCLRIHS